MTLIALARLSLSKRGGSLLPFFSNRPDKHLEVAQIFKLSVGCVAVYSSQIVGEQGND
jgi:hypothetical protein